MFGQGQDARLFMVGAIFVLSPDLIRLFRRETGHHDIFSLPNHPLHDGQDVPHLFPFSEYDFREALSETPMMVDAGETDILKGKIF
jgi:hypothetical protein